MFQKMKFLKKWTAIALSGILLSISLWIPPALAEEVAPQRYPYFGDLHTHTTYSLDAYVGLMRNDPNAAYEFASGGCNIVPGGPQTCDESLGIPLHKLKKELDFAAVTDHAEFMAEVEMAINKDPEYGKKYYHPLAIAIRNKPQSETLGALVFVKVMQGSARNPNQPERTNYGSGPEADIARANAWKNIQQATEDYYEPGTFTTLHAFEWSSAPGGANLHRNVIFRDKYLRDENDELVLDESGNPINVLPEVPFSLFDSQSPEVLWDELEQYEANGATVLAIPHNGNVSANMMFMPERFTGIESADDPCDCDDDGDETMPDGPVYDDSPITQAWAEKRAKYEPLVEIMQIKGNSETLPAYAPEDEFANFELMQTTERTRGRYGYVREALKNGLRHEEDLGANPFKYGIIGATDNHNGSPGDTYEDDYLGSHGFTDATPELRQFSEIPGWESLPYLNPGAITGVWAEENTRGSIFDALKRKEAFATSGSRLKVRFFGGWNFPDNFNTKADAVDIGYTEGVPMGQDLKERASEAPKFMVWAMKDADGANLDRIQVVKGWTKHGLTYEKIYDVVGSDDRTSDPETHKLPPLESTVDVGNATYENTIGEAELSEVWTDPDFDPTARAFYYLRALEIPTPRYSTYDAAELGIVPNSVVATEVQDRAWSSPIWYTPSDEDLAAGEANALTVEKLEAAGIQPLTTQEIKDLISGNDFQIANRITGEEFMGFFQPVGLRSQQGTWYLAQSANYVPMHSHELEAAAPMKYEIADDQLSFNLKDDSEFVAQLFVQNGKILAARNDEIGYVNYELTDLEQEIERLTQRPKPSEKLSSEDFWDLIIQQVEKHYSIKQMK
ncbi:MAG: DUF3604 domain-containing protein [Okeania sp. SIO2C2]|uniref:DUF3604 domain-containing protein n=1 Tax=Okeania sp. SIO2C2 TaxID=2607787 RepID=UPI0013BA3D84|nr:DUF3604 domain-containing protein [Okeania sp. SIO2C2]NEP85912.1 DUF3604 domain-containing protein [Okeania sp. SIO2C2]